MLFELALTHIQGIGNANAKILTSYCGSAENVFKANRHKLLSIPNIGDVLAENILTQKEKVLKKAEDELVKCQNNGVHILYYTQPNYPSRLKQHLDSPVVLFFQGNADLENPMSIAIVGTRQATNYGKEITEEIIASLAPHNPLIVSGLAYGIDIIAHKACIKHQVANIAAMATGMDKIYPAVHKKVAETIIQNGGLITEYPLGSKPDAPHFPERNRIIAGMTDVTIVVEAAAKGGALITAEFANNYNKEVFAVPGKLKDTYSEGCNNLIKNHKANIYTNVDNLLQAMNWDITSTARKPQKTKNTRPTNLNEPENKIFDLLQLTPEMQIDELSWKSQLSMSETASILLGLEFAGHIKSLPGKKYRWNN